MLVGPIKETIDERKIESKLNYCYQRFDTQDLVVAGRIGDVESNYQLLADLGMYALLSIYCGKGKDFDQVFFKKEMKEILQVTKLKGSGPHIEPFRNRRCSRRKGM